MKRDIDLVREILLVVAESEGGVDANVFVKENNDINKVIYTIDIMKQAGLIRANIIKAYPDIYIGAEVKALTWDGHDFLDTIRSSKVWEEVKKRLVKTVKGASFKVIKELAERVVLDLVL